MGGGRPMRCLELVMWSEGQWEALEEKDDWLNQSINNKVVYRTAPATPGLLKTVFIKHMVSVLIDLYKMLSANLFKSLVDLWRR